MAEPIPARRSLTLYRGDTRIWDDEFTLDGEPMNLTGYTLSAQIRTTPDSEDVQAVIDCAVLNAAQGRVRRTLTAEESRKLIAGRAYWDYQLIRTSDNFVRTYMAGSVKVIGDVSRT